MDIQNRIDRIMSLIEKISDVKEYRKNKTLAAEFLEMSEDPCLPKVFREFCFNLHTSVLGDKTGPLDTASKNDLKKIFSRLRIDLSAMPRRV